MMDRMNELLAGVPLIDGHNDLQVTFVPDFVSARPASTTSGSAATRTARRCSRRAWRM